MLDTPSGRLVQSLYESGCKLGVSSRGWASLRDLPGKHYKCIMSNFELITFDFVTEPSTKGAFLLPYVQRYPGPVPQQDAAVAMSRLGLGSVLPEQLPELPHVRDLQAGFADFQRGLQVRPSLVWCLWKRSLYHHCAFSQFLCRLPCPVVCLSVAYQRHV